MTSKYLLARRRITTIGVLQMAILIDLNFSALQVYGQVRQIFDKRGWPLPNLDYESVKSRQEIEIDGVKVTVVEYEVPKDNLSNLDLFSIGPDGTLSIVREEVEVSLIASRFTGNRPYAIIINYDLIGRPKGGGKVYIRRIPIGYFDNDGDGVFETRVDAISLFQKIPEWAIPAGTRPPPPPRKLNGKN